MFLQKNNAGKLTMEFDDEEVVSMFEHKDSLYGVTILVQLCIHKETGFK